MERFAVSERRLTAEEFLQIPEDGKRHELVDGMHYVTPSSNLPHQVLVGRLYLSLGAFLDRRPEAGQIFLGPVDVVLSDRDVVDPAERRVTVLRRASDGSFPEVAALGASPATLLETPLVPGWSLDLADLFRS